MLAPRQSHQTGRVVSQAALAQGYDAASFLGRTKPDDRLEADKRRQGCEDQSHAQQRGLQHQAQQVAASLQAMKGEVEDHRRGLRPRDVNQRNPRPGARQGLQTLGVDQVRIGQNIGAKFLVHDQHRMILFIDHDRNPLRAGQGAQAFNLDRSAEGRAGGAAQSDRGWSLACDQF
ncbi:hypothetical protein D3C87_1257480 [compost metagenome]